MTVSGILKCALALGFTAGVAAVAPAQDTANLPYMNPQLSAQQRAEDLVHRMTLEEKATQMANQAEAIVDAVQQGYLPESALNTALVRLFTARIKLGMFDPPEMVPYSKIDEKELDSPEHRTLARKIANESMVLLKNDGTLPLKAGIKNIAVVGPLAAQTRVLLGNYAGTPTHSVSMLDGLKAEFPNAKMTYVAGTQFLNSEGTRARMIW